MEFQLEKIKIDTISQEINLTAEVGKYQSVFPCYIRKDHFEVQLGYKSSGEDFDKDFENIRKYYVSNGYPGARKGSNRSFRYIKIPFI